LLQIHGNLGLIETTYIDGVSFQLKGKHDFDWLRNGSILYDFNMSTTKICDIDFYNQKPYINTMGRLWGSSRFMSPEEFELGAQIDSRTNVFNMGATAFVLLGGEKDRNLRYSSVIEFFTAWQTAVCN
jgi:serine/threonine protein kinase